MFSGLSIFRHFGQIIDLPMCFVVNKGIIFRVHLVGSWHCHQESFIIFTVYSETLIR